MVRILSAPPRTFSSSFWTKGVREAPPWRMTESRSFSSMPAAVRAFWTATPTRSAWVAAISSNSARVTLYLKSTSSYSPSKLAPVFWLALRTCLTRSASLVSLAMARPWALTLSASTAAFCALGEAANWATMSSTIR